MFGKAITVVCGHYGAGKTNLSMNLAFDSSESTETTLIDLDIVNPYFRSSDYRAALEARGIRVIGPNFANTNADTPSLPPSVDVALARSDRVIIDAGGDDVGATVLGRYSEAIRSRGYDMIYVINMYRSMTQTPEEAVDILRSIEAASKLKATGIVNNSHLKDSTDADTVKASLDFAAEVSRMTSLPLLFTTAPRVVADSLNKITNVYPLDIHVRTPWE
ncbi:MAG: hypothetical protein PHI62_03090 [Candidatus Methanomethylophilaceae archaeon]|nr:hypothetical protein [Candidatus Methanomethylophilaceae archaeon]